MLRRRGGGHRRNKTDGARSGGALGEGPTIAILLVLLVARIEVLEKEWSETRRTFSQGYIRRRRRRRGSRRGVETVFGLSLQSGDEEKGNAERRLEMRR